MSAHPSTGGGPNIDLRIGRLVLDGFNLTPRERLLVQAGLESELSRLFGEGLPIHGRETQVLLAGGAVPSLRAEGISLEPGLAPHLFGERIARAVFDSLAGGILPIYGQAAGDRQV